MLITTLRQIAAAKDPAATLEILDNDIYMQLYENRCVANKVFDARYWEEIDQIRDEGDKQGKSCWAVGTMDLMRVIDAAASDFTRMISSTFPQMKKSKKLGAIHKDTSHFVFEEILQMLEWQIRDHIAHAIRSTAPMARRRYINVAVEFGTWRGLAIAANLPETWWPDNPLEEYQDIGTGIHQQNQYCP